MIKVKNLTKKFSDKIILNNLDLEFINGVNCLLGPNGSGKTTILLCICGMYNYDGELIINGKRTKNIFTIENLETSFVPDEDKIDYLLTGFEFLMLSNSISKKTKNFKEKVKIYSKLFNFEPYLDILVTKYSHGTVKKLTLISSLLNSPKILILDEPFNGLDPEITIILKRLLKALSQNGVTIILSSHNLDIVEELSDKVFLIKDGKKLYEGTANQFKKNTTFEQQFLEITNNSQNVDIIKNVIKFY